MINFQKTNPTCSNVILIDENKCISSSVDILNQNFLNLDSILQDLKSFDDGVSQISLYDGGPSFFSQYQTISADMLNTANNIKTINDNIDSAMLTVTNLSSTWLKPITLYYPQMFEIQYFIDQYSNGTPDFLVGWIGQYFPPQDNIVGQKIKVYINTYQIVKFYFNFTRTYYESCGPNVSGDNTVQCTSCPDNRPFQGCNITGIGCRNAWSYCFSNNKPTSNTYTCVGAGAKYLNVTLQEIDLYDQHYAKNYQYDFICNADENNDNYWSTL